MDRNIRVTIEMIDQQAAEASVSGHFDIQNENGNQSRIGHGGNGRQSEDGT